jgi:hypothetical protein
MAKAVKRATARRELLKDRARTVESDPIRNFPQQLQSSVVQPPESLGLDEETDPPTPAQFPQRSFRLVDVSEEWDELA